MVSAPIERIAFDIGGTFTDVIVLRRDGSLQTAKILSLLESVGWDIRVQLKLADLRVASYIHGTTVAANALLERKVARVGLLTTAGFRDVLEMRSQRRPNIYDANWDRPAPLVPRALRLELGERVRACGAIETPLDLDEARRKVDALVADGAQAIAVCLINAFANPAHEQALARIIRDLRPPMPVSIASEEFAEVLEGRARALARAGRLFQLAPVAYAELDDRAVVRRVNARFVALAGAGPSAFIGKSLQGVLSPGMITTIEEITTAEVVERPTPTVPPVVLKPL